MNRSRDFLEAKRQYLMSELTGIEARIKQLREKEVRIQSDLRVIEIKKRLAENS